MQFFPARSFSSVRTGPGIVFLALALLITLIGFADSPSASAAEGDEYVVDITFPHPAGSGYYYSDTYDACRSGCSRLHRATDIMADKMVTVHAVTDGEICFAPGIDEPMPSYGYMIRLCGDDGLRYDYIHLNNDTPGTDDGLGGPEQAYAPGIERGVRVERGQHIGWVGDSGNAEQTGAHNHFEIHEGHDSEVRINPFNSLQAAEARGDHPESLSPIDAPDESGRGDAEGTGSDASDESPSGAPGPVTGSADESSGSDTAALDRLSGPTRIETAVALSRQTRSAATARAVVIVPSASHVEALVAAPLAGLLDAPVLLSGAESLPESVREEITRLGTANAYVVGSTEVLGGQIERDLDDLGVSNVARLTADDRYGLSVAVASEFLAYGDGEPVGEVMLALGDAAVASRAWPDALSASALSAQTGIPILLTEGAALPGDVADFLTEQRPDQITVVGGTAAIEESVAEDAAAVAGADVRRLAGATRYATSVAVAEAGVDAGLDSRDVWIATGRNFPDALAAGPAAAASGSPLVLVDGEGLAGSPESEAWLTRHADGVVMVGGEAAIGTSVADALAR